MFFSQKILPIIYNLITYLNQSRMIGDTVTIAMKVRWDAMYEKIEKDNFVEKFIVE